MPRPRNPTDAIDKYVGSRVRMRRKMLGKSQTDLADALGLTFQQVQKYENGKTRISPSRMFDIGTHMGVPAEFFYEGAAQVEPSAAATASRIEAVAVQELFTTRDGLDLARAFLAIEDSKMRVLIVALVCGLAERHDSSGELRTDGVD